MDRHAWIRLLLVDDDEDDYVLTRDLLAEMAGSPLRAGLGRRPTSDGPRSACSSGRHDVYLLDYRLGARTGLDLLREAVGAAGCTAPIILLTGQGDREIDLEAMQAGAADYLVKGKIDAALLERSIRYAVQQRRIEEERIRLIREQEARRQAEEANRAKDEFLAMVSHELRTPLNAVLGWVTLLNSGTLDADAQARAVEVIERNAKAQAKLIDDLLDVARIVTGTLQPRAPRDRPRAGGRDGARRRPPGGGGEIDQRRGRPRPAARDGGGRPRPPPADRLEPPLERRQVHPQRRAHRESASRGTAPRPCSPSPTRAGGSPLLPPLRLRALPPGEKGRTGSATPASASASPSPATSSSSTAAPSASTAAAKGAAPPSRSGWR